MPARDISSVVKFCADCDDKIAGWALRPMPIQSAVAPPPKIKSIKTTTAMSLVLAENRERMPVDGDVGNRGDGADLCHSVAIGAEASRIDATDCGDEVTGAG